MDVNFTKQAVQKILTGVLIIAFGAVVIDLFSPDSVDAMRDFSRGRFDETLVQWLVCAILTAAATIVGYVFYLGGMKNFAAQLDSVGMSGAKTIHTSIILMIIGAALSVIPIISFTGGILAVIGWALMLSGFDKLKKSESFSAESKSAIGLLFVGALLGLIGESVDFIPFMGWMSWVLITTSLGLQIAGWVRLNSSIR